MKQLQHQPQRNALVGLAILAVALNLPALRSAEPAREATYHGLQPDAFMTKWLVLAPIPVSDEKSPDEAAQKRAFANDLLASAGGEGRVQPMNGAKVTISGKDHTWRLVASSNDVIDLKAAPSPEEFSVAYAWAEIDMPQAAKAVLGVGSDDGVKVWLNGNLIHENWVGRAAHPDDDVVPVEFQSGRNGLLLKIQNMRGPWGFVCRLMGSESQAKKLVTAAARGDVDAVKLLLDRGVDVNHRAPSGLTAVQSARLRGQIEIVDFLVSKGADARAPLPPPDKLVDGLFRSLIKPDMPGAAVLVAKDGKILCEQGYGLASLEHRVAVTPETKFRIGSVSKQFIAAAILKLQEQGKLRIEDKLAKYIPDYPRGDEVTIHHLLTHTSGIRSYTGKPDFFETVTVGVKAEDHIKSFKNDPYDFDPGKKWSYNNSGYFLLGYIIEKVAGQPYGEYLRQAFFEPLGMKATGVHEAKAILPHEATGYSFEAGKYVKALNWDMSKAGGAGSLYSTVGDLYRWNEGVFRGGVLAESSLEAAFTPVRTADEDAAQPKEAGYGYGWSIQMFRGQQDIGHGGGLNGFVSHLLRLPKENFTVAVLVNCAPPPPEVDPGSLAHTIAEFYLGDKLAPRVWPKIDTTLPVEKLEAIVGRYDYGQGIMVIRRKGSQVFAQLASQPEFEIYPKSETNFFWKAVEAEVTFVKNAQGQVTKAVHRQGGQIINAPRLEDVQETRLSAAQLDAVTGRYDYGGGKAILTVTREGDRLFAQLSGQPKFEIFALSEMEFVWKAVAAKVTFVKNDDGKVLKAVHDQSGRKFDAPRLE